MNALFLALCAAHGVPQPQAEYPFAKHIGRKWRFDYAWIKQGRVALEIQGGIWTRGGHVRGAHLRKEYEKLNHAAILGWRVMFTTPEQINDGEIFPLLREALK